MSIPVICDRCRSTGRSGSGDFTHLGDLLDFAPVPRKTQRVDGWSPDRQRAFIAALSATGSKRRAAMAIGMAPTGADQLLKAPGNASFKAAYERALAIAEQNGAMKIAAGIADAAARNAQLAPPSRLRGAPAPLEGEGDENSDIEAKLEVLERLAAKFMRKVESERRARLAGESAAADFYLRQITCLEVAFDLMATEGLGLNAWDKLADIRRGGNNLAAIVDTPFTQFLDGKRREYWAADPSEPPRPIAFREEFLEDHTDHRTERDQHAFGAITTPARGYTQEQWAAMGMKEQQAARAAQCKQDAAEQLEWEAAARREYESSRDRAAAADHSLDDRNGSSRP